MKKIFNRKIFLASCFLLFASSFFGCATGNIFSEPGENIAGPNGIAIDSAANRLYLVNSNDNVLYDWKMGSMQIYDISDPLKPKLLDTKATDSFSGTAILDDARKLLYISNRFSEDENSKEDHLFVMNIDESSKDYLSIDLETVKKDPYELFCCYPAERMWISNGGDALQYMELADRTLGEISLKRDLSDGGTLTSTETSFIAVLNNQAFLPRNNGGLLIVNLDEAEDLTKNPVDYWVNDLTYPEGIATDGKYIYLVDQDNFDDEWRHVLLIIDPAKLPPLTDNDKTIIKDKDDDELITKYIEVIKYPNRVFVTKDYAFVTSNNESGEKGVVTVVDLATQTKKKEITVGDEPFVMALYAPGGVEKYLYVGNLESNTLSIIDIDKLEVAATYPES